jgi:hypothetical protein
MGIPRFQRTASTWAGWRAVVTDAEFPETVIDVAETSSGWADAKLRKPGTKHKRRNPDKILVDVRCRMLRKMDRIGVAI